MNYRLPKTLPDIVIDWFSKNARDLPFRKTKEPYKIWISEIMLQQTRVTAMLGYYEQFLSTFPTIQSLANADDDVLHKCWEGLGYYNRAKNLKRAAQRIMDDFGGVFPEDFNDILSLPGIGTYTAGAVASICFNQPIPAIDGNVLRVILRVIGSFDPIDSPSTKEAVFSALEAVYPNVQPGNFTEGLMEIGAQLCLPHGEPKCTDCPLLGFCTAASNSETSKIPVKNPKKERSKTDMTVFLIHTKNRIAIQKRSRNGLLSGLWEFPNCDRHLSIAEAREKLKEWGIQLDSIQKGKDYRHQFTHVEWNMNSYIIEAAKENNAFKYVSEDELNADHALPTAFRKLQQ